MTDGSRGLFVVLEGGEACGKSTQLHHLGDRLEAQGVDVVLTREPGGTPVGEALRALVLEGEGLDARAEALAIAADRAEHVRAVVRPALERGAIVVSDRYVPSSLCYQGVGRGLGVDEVERLSTFATGGLAADLVIVLDVPEDVAAARSGPVRDRMEAEGEDFHARVRAAYRELSPERGWVVLDGTGSPEEVEARVWSHVEPLVDSKRT